MRITILFIIPHFFCACHKKNINWIFICMDSLDTERALLYNLFGIRFDFRPSHYPSQEAVHDGKSAREKVRSDVVCIGFGVFD